MRSLIVAIGILIISTPAGSGFADDFSADQFDTSAIRINECIIRLADDRKLASGQSGIISMVHVREGDKVKKGQLLAELEAAVPKASLAVAEIQANNNVNERFARLAAKVAQAEYESVLDAIQKNASTFSPIHVKKTGLERDRSVVEIEVAEHEFDVNQLRRDEAAALVASYRIVAPMDGMISRVYKAAGEAVQVGETLLVCQNTDPVHVEADIKIHLLKEIRKGRRVRIIPTTSTPAVAAEAREAFGTVFFVGVHADLTSSTVRVLVEADNQQGLLLAGTNATIEIPPDVRSSRSGTRQPD